MENKSSQGRKELSCDVSKALDLMKYGYDDIKTRVQIYKIFQEAFNKSTEDDERSLIFAGSRVEGVTHAEEPDSDIDMMFVSKQWICCDDLHKSELYPGKIVLELVTERTAPGYTMLKCKSSDRGCFSREKELFVQKCYGQRFLCHLLSLDFGYDKTISGPAFTALLSAFDLSELISLIKKKEQPASKVQSLSMDCVLAIPYIRGEHLQKWKERISFTSWPGQELIEEISQMNGHVVPVGSKGSEDCHLEWRICHTEAEIKLVQSMNETQLKLYVLLKMVAKKILKPICPDISSYIIKNALFWFVERTPADRFKPENLLDLMEKALESLHSYIDEQYLPNYMIAERNLFAGRLGDDIKVQLLAELHDLIHVQGPTFLLHHKHFGSLKLAIEQVRQGENEEPLTAAGNSQQSQLSEFLQKLYNNLGKKEQEYLDTIISTLSEEQIEQTFLDIVLTVPMITASHA